MKFGFFCLHYPHSPSCLHRERYNSLSFNKTEGIKGKLDKHFLICPIKATGREWPKLIAAIISILVEVMSFS